MGRRQSEKNMDKRVISLALCAMLLALCVPAAAEQPAKVPRIGYLTGTREPTHDAPDANRDAFRQGLRDLGYIEGKNILIEYRYAAGKQDPYPKLCGRTGATQG
jgi:putative tryptophan/tyrosine transport system substrate-binding protein